MTLPPSPLTLLFAAGLAQDPAASPSTPPEPAPAEQAAPAEPAAPVVEEVRETWNDAGRLARRLVIRGGQLVEETTWTWSGDQLVGQETTRDGQKTTEVWTRDAAGNPLTHVVTRDGQEVLQETWTYADGRVATLQARTAEGTTTTTWTWNARGEVIAEETRDASGALLSRRLSDRAEPAVAKLPVKLALSGGLSTNSDVRTTSLTLGWSLERKPSEAQYADHPLEVRAGVDYTLGRSLGVKTNDALNAGFGLDYNELLPRFTVFLFLDLSRNPVANLDLDLEAAPIGAKYVLIRGGPLTWDLSFAPVWNYRSILVAAGDSCDDAVVDADTHCPFSKVRGSVRTRLKVAVGDVSVKDTIEFLPTLNPDDGDIVGAVASEAIFRNTFGLSVALSRALSLSWSSVFTRDPLLVAQADCDADPDNLLCDGLSLTTTGTLALSASF